MDLSSLNNELVKYLVVLLATPIWWPFLKALYTELNESLRDEGGLFGHEPSSDEVAEMHWQHGPHQSAMLHEPFERPGESKGFSPSADDLEPRRGFDVERERRGFTRR